MRRVWTEEEKNFDMQHNACGWVNNGPLILIKNLNSALSSF